MCTKSRRFVVKCLLLGLFIFQCSPDALRAATVGVSIGDNLFSPPTSTINVNDTVMWTWNGNNNHSSTSNAGDTTTWDSGILGHNATFSKQFTAAGSFPYHCNVHANQFGTVTVNSAANTPPSVTITNPSNGTVFSAPAGFTLGASASDTDGSVTNVQFRQGSTILTNDPSKPYSFPLINLAAGSYTFSAIASDNVGAKSTNSISITVNALPIITVTNPADGSAFSAAAMITISAAASDSDGSVTNIQFMKNNVVFTNRAALPYIVTTSNLPAGSYTLSAVAVDNRNGKTTNTISVSVLNPQAIVLTAPQRVSGTNFQFQYTADPGLKYVVEQAASVGVWNPLVTNTATGNPVTFVHTNASPSPRFYRVGRLPNP